MNVYQQVSTTPAIGCFQVSMAPAINPYNGFSVIASVIDTSHKFITWPCCWHWWKITAGASDQGVWGSMVAPFHGDSYDTVGSHVRLCRPEISPFWFIAGVITFSYRCGWYWSEITKKPKIYCRRQQHRWKTVSTIPAINFSPVSVTLAIWQCCQCQLAYTWKWKISKNSIYNCKVHSSNL